MKQLLAVGTFLFLCGTGAAEPKTKSHLEILSPFLDQQTVGIFHLNLKKADLKPLYKVMKRVGKFSPEDQIKLQLMVGLLRGSGVEKVYAVTTLWENPFHPVFVVIPQTKPGKAKQQIKLIKEVVPQAHFKELEGTLVIGSAYAVNRLQYFTPQKLPELRQTLIMGKDADAFVFWTFPPSFRKAVSEIFPSLPKELGGFPTSLFIQNFRWGLVTVKSRPSLSMKATLQLADKEAAVSFKTTIAKVFKQTRTAALITKKLTPADQFALGVLEYVEENLHFKVVEDQLVLQATEKDLIPLGKPNRKNRNQEK